MRSGEHGNTKSRRLEQVVPADRGQGAAHEGDVRGRVEPAELPDRVDQDARRAPSGCPFTPAQGLQAYPIEEGKDLGDALEVARRQNEHGGRELLLYVTERPDDGFFLAGVRAAGHEDRSLSRDGRGPADL